jgi:hypothetical protein
MRSCRLFGASRLTATNAKVAIPAFSDTVESGGGGRQMKKELSFKNKKNPPGTKSIVNPLTRRETKACKKHLQGLQKNLLKKVRCHPQTLPVLLAELKSDQPLIFHQIFPGSPPFVLLLLL